MDKLCYQLFKGKYTKDEAFGFAQESGGYLPDPLKVESTNGISDILKKEGTNWPIWGANILENEKWISEYNKKEVLIDQITWKIENPKAGQNLLAISKNGKFLSVEKATQTYNVLIFKDMLSCQ